MDQKQQPKAGAAQPGPDAEFQLGESRGIGKDERLKRVVKRHPQRDEPRVDSVDTDELPPA
jgi:hypothetical protein